MKEIRRFEYYFLYFDYKVDKYIIKHKDRFSLWFVILSYNLESVVKLKDEEFVNRCEVMLQNNPENKTF